MTGETHENRAIFRITGGARVDFLQNLVTNDVTRGGLMYGALLTPQGKFIADFFLLDEGDAFLIDTDAALAPTLIQKLNMYKLRADVQIEETDLHAVRGRGEAPEGAHPDPRHPELGWRLYTDTPGTPAETDWDALRVELGIPTAGEELTADTLILEAGFEQMSGVDFKKGCFVGQEVTARMKHKTQLRKGVVPVAVEGEAEPGTEILTEEGKPAGRLHTRAGDRALAYLRFDRAEGPLTAGDARVTWIR
jgi:hypothetical protein